MNLSVIIPVFNEKATMYEIISQVRSVWLEGIELKEIIIVDDCSTDGTKEWLLNIKKKFNHLGLKKNKLVFSKK